MSQRVPEYRDGFDPSRSTNPFIRGEKIYRFIWGQPLCVRCGTTGHLPKQCTGLELLKMEQEYLYRLMKEEQDRSKRERGLHSCASTADLRPATRSQALVDPLELPRMPAVMPEVSMLDAPGSPGEERGAGESGLPSQRELFQMFKAQQRGGKHRTTGHDQTRFQAKKSQQYDRKWEGPGASPPGQETFSTFTGADFQRPYRFVQADVREELQPPVIWPANQWSPDDNAGYEEQRMRKERFPVGSVAPPADSAQAFRISPHSGPASLQIPPLPARAGRRLLAMGATKRMSNGEPKVVGPHPSTIRVSTPYVTQSAIEKRLQVSSTDAQERSLAEAREDTARLQGVVWLDSTRRALQLPIRTFTTACVYFHKFRLAHPSVEYNWADAAAASLLTSCKNEDTLKKSRDILAAAYNLKQLPTHEHVGSDDAIFEASSRVVIGLERLVLESGGFDFRSRSPHHTLIKIGKSLPATSDQQAVVQLAWTVLTDLHRTFAPLKQTSATLALASLELASHFHGSQHESRPNEMYSILQNMDLSAWHASREEVMETLLDALDLYTHHTTFTVLGGRYSLDDLLRIRLSLNKECSNSSLPRYTVPLPPPSPDDAPASGTTLKLANGHPTPVSPPQTGSQAPQQTDVAGPSQAVPEGGGTLRFMLSPQRATNEKGAVARYYVEEWEEYEEEIEIPISRPRSRDRDRERNDRNPDRHDREQDSRSKEFDDRRSNKDERDIGRGSSERDRLRDRERDVERERARIRERERDRRYDDRRYDDRERDRRYDDRRDRGRDRRFYDDDRRRPRDDRR